MRSEDVFRYTSSNKVGSSVSGGLTLNLTVISFDSWRRYIRIIISLTDDDQHVHVYLIVCVHSTKLCEVAIL